MADDPLRVFTPEAVATLLEFAVRLRKEQLAGDAEMIEQRIRLLEQAWREGLAATQ